MARSQEKAMLLLNRFYAAKQQEGKPAKARRPYLASECDDLKKAERWRLQIIREISRKVSQIQNPGLGEFRIRDLNDHINKLLREKIHWQERIVQLGGVNYNKVGPRMLDQEGKEVPGNRGYKYFGAARDLPGVRDLFENKPTKAPRKTRSELAKFVDADYYGYRDEEDGILLPLEQEEERKAVAAAVSKWQELKLSGGLEGVMEDDDDDDDIYSEARLAELGGSDSEKEDGNDDGDDEDNPMSKVVVPSQQEVEEMLVRRKKMELLDKYASETLIMQGEEAKTLLGYS